MAKTATAVLSVRVPLDLLERVDAAGARTDIMVAALRAYLNPTESVPDERAARAERRAAELETENRDLQRKLICRPICWSDCELVDGNAAIDPRVAELEAENARLVIERDQWRDRAQAIVNAGKAPITAEGRRLARAVDPLSRHPSGPVLASAAPDLAGATPWCGLKGIDKPKR